MHIETIFDPQTFTLTYIVHDEFSKDAFVVDPVLDFDPQSSTLSHENIDKVDKYIQENKLNLIYIIDTHAHADHLSASHELKKKYPESKTVIGENITKVQTTFKGVFNLNNLEQDGSQFDILTSDQEELPFGKTSIKMISTPGHTPACISLLLDDNLFSGDSLFMPDFGTGRCDFPAGSADDLYTSVHEKLYSLPDNTKVFVGHDYGTGGREIQWETTIGESKKHNIQLKDKTTREEFVKFRTERDATLKEPKLIFQSIQVNINAGELPKAESNEVSYLKIPLLKSN
jgi:glyoxylase-like metal-dependent hydrolase (beta-lactamase superfamily II)